MAFQTEDYPQLLKLSLFSKFNEILANPREYTLYNNNEGPVLSSNFDSFVIPGTPNENILAGRSMKLTMFIQKDTRTWEEELGITSIGNPAVRMTLILHTVGDYPQFYNGKYSFKNYMNTPFTDLFNVVAYVSFKVNDKLSVRMCTHLWNRTKMNNKPLESDYSLDEYNRQALNMKMAHDSQLFDAEYMLTQGVGLEMLCLVNKYILNVRNYSQLAHFADILHFQINDARVKNPIVLIKLSKKHLFKVIDTDLFTNQSNDLITRLPEYILDAMINFYKYRSRILERQGQPGNPEYDNEMLKLLEKTHTTRYSTPQEFASAIRQYVPSYVQDINEDQNIEYFIKLKFQFEWRGSDYIMMGQTAQNVISICDHFAVKK
jgi:hypothetical protein